MARHVRESARDIELEIRRLAEKDADIAAANHELAEQVKEFVQSKTPVDTGAAAGSIAIKKLKKTRDHPLPGYMVYSDDPMFPMIEYGTQADPATTKSPRRVEIDGKWVTLDRDTPTQAAAPFGQARARFGTEIR